MKIIQYCILTLALCLLFEGNVHAQGKTHTVRRGETLYKLSRLYNVTVAELRSWNGLSGNLIRVGQKLKVGEEDATPTGDLSAYDVALLGLEKGKMSVDEAAMKLSLLNDLQREQALASAQESEVEGFFRGGSEEEFGNERLEYYQVKPGDDLFSIADAFEVTVEDLRFWNTINGVQPGDVIIARKWRDVPILENSIALPQNMPTRGAAAPTASSSSVPVVSPFYYEDPGSVSPYNTPSVALPAFSFDQVQGGEVIYAKNVGVPDTDSRSTSFGPTRGEPILPAQDAPLVVLPGPSMSSAREVGPYGTFSIPNYTHFRFYGAHKVLPIGTKVKVDLPNNPGHVEVTIVDQLPAGSPLLIGLSPSVVKLLKAAGAPSQVSLMY